jgi:hypothetical protein
MTDLFAAEDAANRLLQGDRFRWLAMLESGQAKSLKEIATRKGIDYSYVSRMVNLTTPFADLADFIPIPEGGAGERTALERAKPPLYATSEAKGEVRSLPHEPATTRGFWRDQTKKAPTESGWGFGTGGGGGNRTRVREPSARRSTCLFTSIVLTACYPTDRENNRRSLERFNPSAPGGLQGDPVSYDARNLKLTSTLSVGRHPTGF